MNGKFLKTLVISLLVLPVLTFAQPRPPAPRPRPPAPRPVPPPPPPRFHHPRPPRGEWFAIGGISYMFGSAIRAYERPTTTVIYTQCTPQTVVYAQPAPQTVIIQQPTVQTTVSRASLKAEIAALLNEQLKGIPCSVQVEDFFLSSGNYGASITVVCAINGTNYSITASALQSGYENLKNKIVADVVSAVNKANSKAQPDSVKIQQIP